MSFERYLENYANLIVNFALALKPGDKLAINFNADCLPLVRLVTRKAYQNGVLDVFPSLNDETMVLDRYLYAPEEAFEHFPPYRVEYMEKMFQDRYHRLSLVADNPELLKSVDPARIAKWQKTAGQASKPLMAYTMAGQKPFSRICLRKKP